MGSDGPLYTWPVTLWLKLTFERLRRIQTNALAKTVRSEHTRCPILGLSLPHTPENRAQGRNDEWLILAMSSGARGTRKKVCGTRKGRCGTRNRQSPYETFPLHSGYDSATTLQTTCQKVVITPTLALR